MPKQNPNSPQTVLDKVIALFDQFSREQPVLTLGQLVQRSGVSRSTAHRLLQALIKERYVMLTNDGYALGIRLFELGMTAQQNLNFADMLDGVLAEFSAEIGETLIVSKQDGDQLLFVHVIEPANPLRYVVAIGERRPIQWGASGLSILSQLQPEQRLELVQSGLIAFTDQTTTDLSQWNSQIEQVNQQGYAVTYGEYFEGIGAIAIPLKQRTPMALSVVGPKLRIRDKESTIIAGLRQLQPKFNALVLA